MAINSVWADVPIVKGSDIYGIGADYITAQTNTEQNEALQSRDLYLLNKFKEYYTQNEIDNLFSTYTTNLDWKESVDTYEDILRIYDTTLEWKNDVESYGDLFTVYPNPEDGWTVNVKNVRDRYTFVFDEAKNVTSIKVSGVIFNGDSSVSLDNNSNELIMNGIGLNGGTASSEIVYGNWKEIDLNDYIDTTQFISMGEMSYYEDILSTYPVPKDKWIVDILNPNDNYTYTYSSDHHKWLRVGQKALPEDGWVVNTKDTNYTYRYDKELNKWIAISANAIPLATEDVDGLLSKEDYAYIRQIESDIIPLIYLRMNQMEERALPLGSIVPYVNEDNTPPAGFVFAEGGLYNRTEYPDMWEKLCKVVDDQVIYDYTVDDSDREHFPGKFTKGDGETTFRVPDLRGCFLRGFDAGKGVDSDEEREVGTFQNDSIAEHSHEVDVTGVGSVDDAELDNTNDKLTLAGTTQNEYAKKAVLSLYDSREAETRPKNIAFRFIIKMVPTEKLPLTVDPNNMPSIVIPIDADTLNGHRSSLSAAPGTIPVANEQGKLDNSWFNIDLILEDIYVRRTETSAYPDSKKIPISNSENNLDDWLSIVSEDDVDRWIYYINNIDYNFNINSYDDSKDINKYFVTKKKFIKFLEGLRTFIHSFKQVYTTEDVEPTNDRGYISNAERLKYSDKYTKNETYDLLYNFLQNYIPLTEASLVPGPNKIPMADEDGMLDSRWLTEILTNKIGKDSNTGYAEVAEHEIVIKSGTPTLDNATSGNVTIEGGGTVDVSGPAPAKTIISAYDSVENRGGNVQIYAGSGGTSPSSIGGSVIIQSGSGIAYDGTIDLNNIKVDKNNTIYTNATPITIKQNDNGISTNSLEISSTGLSYVHDNLVNNSDDYRFTLNNDGTVDTNKPNVANGLTILNNSALVPFENLPTTVKVNNLGDLIREQSIDTSLGNVIVGNIAQNSNLTISDYTPEDESKELTFILNCKGPYRVHWPVNVNWIGDQQPEISYGETAVIKLFRIGSGEWTGWKVGDGSSSSEVIEEVLINNTEVPPEEFEGKLHIWIEEDPEEPEEPEIPQLDPSISLSGIVLNGTSDNSVTSESDEIIITDTSLYWDGTTPAPSEPEEPEVPQLDPSISLSGLTLNSDSSNTMTTDSNEIVLTETIFNNTGVPVTPTPTEPDIPEEPIETEPEVGLSGLAMNADSTHLMNSDSNLLKLTDTNFNK